MGREGKMRFMCLACGRFYWSEIGSLVWAKMCCPYCRDIFHADNIVPDIPLPPYGKERFSTLSCGHEIGFDTIGDAVCCPVCRTDIDPAVIEEYKGETLKNWQNKKMKELGI